jgi:hypothetical protein
MSALLNAIERITATLDLLEVAYLIVCRGKPVEGRAAVSARLVYGCYATWTIDEIEACQNHDDLVALVQDRLIAITSADEATSAPGDDSQP